MTYRTHRLRMRTCRSKKIAHWRTRWLGIRKMRIFHGQTLKVQHIWLITQVRWHITIWLTFIKGGETRAYPVPLELKICRSTWLRFSWGYYLECCVVYSCAAKSAVTTVIMIGFWRNFNMTTEVHIPYIHLVSSFFFTQWKPAIIRRHGYSPFTWLVSAALTGLKPKHLSWDTSNNQQFMQAKRYIIGHVVRDESSFYAT